MIDSRFEGLVIRGGPGFGAWEGVVGGNGVGLGEGLRGSCCDLVHHRRCKQNLCAFRLQG